MSAQDDFDPRGNRLLAGLDSHDYERLTPLLEPFEADLRAPVYDPGGPIKHVYFPLRAVFSLVAVGAGGDEVEVATVGREGMVGLPVFLGASSSPNAAFCQVPGRSLRLGADQLRDFLAGTNGSLHSRLHRYTQATIVQLAQSVACNQLHDTQARAGRWLLMTHDRAVDDRFLLTQQFLAQMLGVRRATVSGVAGQLQQDGVIEYTRGQIRIRDRARLEAIACECYRVVRDQHRQLLGD